MNRMNYYLPDDVVVFIKKAAKKEVRSASNWLVMLIRAEMAREKQARRKK